MLSKKTVPKRYGLFGLGLAASNPSRIPRGARGDIRAYDDEMREKRIDSRDQHEILERIVATLQAFGVDAKISPTVPTPWNWEIELESEASDLEDSDSDSESDYSNDDFEGNRLSDKGFAKYSHRRGEREMLEQYRAAVKAAGKEYRAEAAKAAYAKRLEDRAAAVAAAVAAATATTSA
jgi:hypothetical protein